MKTHPDQGNWFHILCYHNSERGRYLLFETCRKLKCPYEDQINDLKDEIGRDTGFKFKENDLHLEREIFDPLMLSDALRDNRDYLIPVQTENGKIVVIRFPLPSYHGHPNDDDEQVLVNWGMNLVTDGHYT